MPSAATYRGVDEFAGFMETWTEDLDGWRFDVERLINGDRDHVVAVVFQHATARASGAPVDLRWGVLFELKGGQVVKMQHFLDIEEALEAAGPHRRRRPGDGALRPSVDRRGKAPATCRLRFGAPSDW